MRLVPVRDLPPDWQAPGNERNTMLAAPSTWESKLVYETQGVLHLPGILDPPFLARLNAAFNHSAAKLSENWLAAGDAAPPTLDIPSILDEDDVFVDLVDLPTTSSLLIEILGSDIQLLQTIARLYRPSKTFVPTWHSDLDTIQGIDPGCCPTLMSKIHFYPEDLTPEQGCLAFIPGSHRYSIGHPRPRLDDQENAGLIKKIVPKAGDAVIFNPHIFHMCLDNRSPHVRKSLIYTYGHFWMKTYPGAAPRDLERLAITRRRKQFFGIQCNPSADYLGQCLPSQGIKNEIAEVVKGGRKLFSKMKDVYFGTSD